MSVPESRRRANDKWDKENMAALTCKVKKADAEKFKATTNAVLSKLVKNYIGEDGQA